MCCSFVHNGPGAVALLAVVCQSREAGQQLLPLLALCVLAALSGQLSTVAPKVFSVTFYFFLVLVVEAFLLS